MSERPGPVLALLVSLFCLVGVVAAAPAQDFSWTEGPTTASLGDQAQVRVPEGYLFADAEMTVALMETMGNPPSGQEVGLITPVDEDASWFLMFEYDPAGWIDDSDGDEIDADGLLDQITRGTEASNEQRAAMGGGELHIVGWTEQPHYDQRSNNLVWAIEAEDEVQDRVVNYNVRLLGRRGYMSVTLVTDPGSLPLHRSEIEGLLAGFSYTDGARYADFVSGDKLAGYGLAALVAGGAGAAAVKLGLFAVLAKMLGKAWKLLVVAVAGLGAGIKKLFVGRKKPVMYAPSGSPMGPAGPDDVA